MSNLIQPLRISLILAILLIGCPYAKSFTWDADTKAEFQNKYPCHWNGFNDKTMSAAEKSAFVNEKIDPVDGINDPLDLWYTFKAPASADFLGIKDLEGEYQPLIFNGKFVSKETNMLIDRKDFTSPKEIVYASVTPKLKNHICHSKSRWVRKEACPRTTNVCMTFTILEKEGQAQDNSKWNRRLLGLNNAVGHKIDVRMFRCGYNKGRFNQSTGVLRWSESRNPWLMEFIHGETWVKVDYYNPFKHEFPLTKAINRACFKQGITQSSRTGPSFLPGIGKKLAQFYNNAGEEAYCSAMLNKAYRRPEKIMRTRGVTDCNAVVEMNNHGYGYKGVFKAGQANDACIRFAYMTKPSRDGMMPVNAGFQLKVFRDNTSACDLSGDWSFKGQTTPNVFQNALSNNIANVTFDDENSIMARFHKQIQAVRVVGDRPGLKSLRFCSKFDGQGTDEQAKDPNATEPFPFALMYVPNPLLQKLCQLYNGNDKNPFECFSELAQSTQLEELLAQNKVKMALAALDDQDLKAEFPDVDLDAEREMLEKWKDVEGGENDPAIQEFVSMKKVTELMDSMRKQLYKIVAIDQPMTPNEVSQDPKAFRCLGYVKRKNTGAFTTNNFTDSFMRWYNEYYNRHSFTPNTKRRGQFWGRDSQVAQKWKQSVNSKNFKFSEGPKEKYWPAYQNHFVPGLELDGTDFAKYVYARSKDYMRCLTRAEMEGTN